MFGHSHHGHAHGHDHHGHGHTHGHGHGHGGHSHGHAHAPASFDRAFAIGVVRGFVAGRGTWHRREIGRAWTHFRETAPFWD